MVQPNRTPERQPNVPLHVAVEAEELAEIILTQVRRVATAGPHALPSFAIARNAKHRRGPFEQRRRGALGDVQPVEYAAAVSRNEIQMTVVAAQDRMCLVIAAGA